MFLPACPALPAPPSLWHAPDGGAAEQAAEQAADGAEGAEGAGGAEDTEPEEALTGELAGWMWVELIELAWYETERQACNGLEPEPWGHLTAVAFLWGGGGGRA